MQGENPVSLAIGTQVSAKYKGAFCEAKVRSVIKEVKCRITFKGGLGSCTLSDEAIKPIDDQPIVQGVTVKAKHPDKQEYLDAIINQIKDQSKYTVTFNDGDIAQLRRNALRLKSGKHFNPSESLDNLPLTHPEHFSTPVGGSKTPGGGGGRRRNRSGAVSERSGQGGSKDRNKDGGDTTDAEKDNDYESEGESENDSAEGNRREGSGPISSAYMPNIGRVVWAENTDKKSKGKETNWFPALVVAPTACDIPTDTKEDFLIRSFKDGRYYTVAKKETNKFDKDNTSKFTKDGNIRDALQKALSYIEKDELPPHWDKEIIFAMDEPTTSTESSESASERSEDGDDDDDSEDDEQTTEEKDHLVAELYKHMEDKGSPINHTPAINGKDVDLYRLYRVVDRLGGHTRVTNKNLWKQVGRKLGFENTWSTNQVRVHYNRYLKSFEELNRTLGCTMIMAPMSRGRHQSGNVNRVQVRGKHRHQTPHQQQSPGQKETHCSSPQANTQATSISSSSLPSNMNPAPSSPATSSRTASPSSTNPSVSSINKADVSGDKIMSSINNLSKNSQSSPATTASSKQSASEATVTPSVKDANNKQSNTRSVKTDVNIKDDMAEKESASKAKSGNKLSRAFHNVIKSIKKSPRSATMEEKEISVSSTDGDDESDKILPKAGNQKSTKDHSVMSAIGANRQPTQAEQKTDMKMSRRQRKNSSTSSLAAAMQAKAQKDDIGNLTMKKDQSSYHSSALPGTKKLTPRSLVDGNSAKLEKHQDKDIDVADNKKLNKTSNAKIPASMPGSVSNASDSASSPDAKADKRNLEKDANAKNITRKMISKTSTIISSTGASGKKKTIEANNITSNKKERDSENKSRSYTDENEKQHLAPDDIVEVGDRIKVFYIRETIYPAKVIQVQDPKNGEKWPRYRVHYDGWNKRYDEWIKRSRIAEFNSEKEKTTTGGPPGSAAEDSEPTSPPSNRKEITRKDSGMSTTSSSSSCSRLDANGSISAKKKSKGNDRDLDSLPKERIVSRSSKIAKLPLLNEREAGSRSATPCSLRGSRTNSPVSTLKRQNSRSSLKKDTDESEAETEKDAEDALSSDSAGGRKSSRLLKGNIPHATAAPSDDRSKRNDRRSDRKRTARDESETDDTDNVKDEDTKDKSNKGHGPTVKPKRGRKCATVKSIPEDSEGEDDKAALDNLRRLSSRTTEKNIKLSNNKTAKTINRATRTPLKGSSSDQEEDPYDFKEPEPFDVCDVKFETPRKQASPSPSTNVSTSSKKIKEEDPISDIHESNQEDQRYSSAIDASTSTGSSKKVLASNLSSIASSTSSASDEGNYSDDEKPKAENIYNDMKCTELAEENPLGGLVSRNRRNVKNLRENEKRIEVDENSEESSNLDVQGDLDDENVSETLTSKSIGASEVGKPLLPLPKKLQEVFPHLAAIRTTALPGNATRSSLPGTSQSGQSNSSTNAVNLIKTSSSQVPSQTSNSPIQRTTTNSHEPSQNVPGRSICTPSSAKQKTVAEISDSINKNINTKVDLIYKDTSLNTERMPPRSRSPISLNIVAEDILATQKSNEINTHKKQRRKPTKPTSSELVGSDSESENENEEDLEADGDVDSNGEDTIYPKSRVRQQQQHHRKRSSSRAESKKDNRSTLPSSTTSSASSNDNSPTKLNKTSPSIKTKKSLVTSIATKPMTSACSLQSSSSTKRKRECDATSETTESDDESSTKQRVLSSQASTKRGIATTDKSKRHKKETTNNSYGGVEQDDLDLACGETIPGSPVHQSQSDLHQASPDQYAKDITNQRKSTSGGINIKIDATQPSGNVAVKSGSAIISSSSNLRSQHGTSSIHSNLNTNHSNRLEMPFASVPESVLDSTMNRTEIAPSDTLTPGASASSSHVKANQTHNGHTKSTMSSNTHIKTKQYQSQREGDIESLQGYSSTSQSPIHGDDSAANSRSKSPIEQGDLQGDSSEVDMDSLSGRGAGSGADSATWPGDSAGKLATKRKTGERLAAAHNILSIRERGSRSPAAGSRSPLPSGQGGKRKKRSRKMSTSGSGALRGRKRHGSGRNGNGMTPSRGDEDSDDDEEGNGEIRQHNDSRQSTRVSSLGSLDNDALAALSQRSPRTSKFNFYVKFDPMMDSTERISKLQTNLEELRKTYMTLRNKLTSIERRRKKIRRRERERTDNPSGPEVEAAA